MASLQGRDGCLASPFARVAFGIGALGVLLVLILVFAGDDDGDSNDGAPEERDSVGEGTAGPRAASGVQSIDLGDGQRLSIELFVAPTAETTILAAPSRNADLTSIVPVGASLVSGDCANVIAFDAQSVDASPVTLYQAVLELLLAGEYGPIFADGFGTLGASFTSLPSWEAARDNGADYNFVFAPSDFFPEGASPDAVPMTFLFVGEDDTGFLPQFEQWREAGVNGATLPGAEHGSALFTGANDDVVLSRLERALCF